MKTIDAVITWVDGQDPVHIAKRKKYGNANFLNSDDVASNVRFNNIGEIFWCIASLNVFAPFLHKIYIVTDDQNPGLDTFLDKAFPNGHIPVEIVDHKVIFRGYEEYLPTFNSISLETMTWRIPGLSEYFLEFNDDLMLYSPITPEDFFTTDGKVICYARKFSTFFTLVTRKLKPKIEGRTKVTFKGSMMNAARLAGQHYWFLKIHHTPKALTKSFYEKYFTEHPEMMIKNISKRFRDASQFTPEELQYLSLLKEGKCEIRPVNGNLFFLEPKRRNDSGYINGKLEKLKRKDDYKFRCFNSIELASEEDRKAVIELIKQRLGISDFQS